ncbi:MAG: bifunctional phosphopantothenoylcysteine decarboxylase/phosphopantothenate--cysteine ligase CoaBC [Bacteroidales bacterium]
MLLKNKNILLGITGSIAAYKAAMLVRLLVKEGADVKIIMTEYAREFITPLTMATLSKNPILVDFFNPENGEWNSHVNLGEWADLYLVAPATANTMGKMANGVADNLLLTTYLSAKCKVMIAPAMDLDMYQHPANLKNIETLKSYGNLFIEPATGELASGLSGKGRMEEPQMILEKVIDFFQPKKKLNGKKFIVTAGPTYEPIDPVRFIGNFSSGKMGFSIAEQLSEQGAEVILVTGPTDIKIHGESIEVIHVQTAEEMYQEVVSRFTGMDGAVLSAAVSDFKPRKTKHNKVKRGNENVNLELLPTKDIARKLGEIKKEQQLLVGFALETDNEEENAKNKIKSKNLDFIVLNSLKEEGAGFQVDTNKIKIIDKHNKSFDFELKSKKKVAKDIVSKIMEYESGE